MQFHSFLQPDYRRVILMSEAKDEGRSSAGADRKRGEFLCLLHFGHSRIEPALPHKLESIPKVRSFIIGVQFQGSSEFPLSSRPVIVMNKLCPGQRGVPFGKRVVKL